MCVCVRVCVCVCVWPLAGLIIVHIPWWHHIPGASGNHGDKMGDTQQRDRGKDGGMKEGGRRRFNMSKPCGESERAIRADR